MKFLKKLGIISGVSLLMFGTMQVSALVDNTLVGTYYDSKVDLMLGDSGYGTNIIDVLNNKNEIVKSAKADFLYKPEGVLYNGIDISSYQGEVDWDLVKEQGVEFVILRAGVHSSVDGKLHEDVYFDEYYEECKKRDIPVGCYWFTRARSTSEAIEEAEFLLDIIEGKQFEYPVCFDIESESLTNLSSTTLTDITIAFCDRIERENYYVSIYTNPNWIDYYLVKSDLILYDKWLAHWTTNPKYGNEFGGLWQFGLGECWGITGDCDLDYSYRDYPTIIKNANLNGF